MSQESKKGKREPDSSWPSTKHDFAAQTNSSTSTTANANANGQSTSSGNSIAGGASPLVHRQAERNTPNSTSNFLWGGSVGFQPAPPSNFFGTSTSQPRPFGIGLFGGNTQLPPEASTDKNPFEVPSRRVEKMQDVIGGVLNVAAAAATARQRINLLQGPGFEVVVGHKPSQQDSKADEESVWSLPQALISHHSPMLRAACERDFSEREKRIELPNVEPKVFTLFVEWMYYGTYSPVDITSSEVSPTYIDAQAWVLANTLRCTPFKNYAMTRLYSRLFPYFGIPVAITTEHMRYVLQNSADGSGLRRLHLDTVAHHFDNPARVTGDAEDWDRLFQEYADARLMLLKTFKSGYSGRLSLVKKVEDYLWKELKEDNVTKTEEINVQEAEEKSVKESEEKSVKESEEKSAKESEEKSAKESEDRQSEPPRATDEAAEDKPKELNGE